MSFTFLYLTDIVDKYQSESTTIISKKVRNPNPTWPTITFCMEKPFKSSILLKVKNRRIFATLTNFELKNVTLLQLYHESVFKIERDFIIEHVLYLNKTFYRMNISLGHNYFQDGSAMFVEEFPTELFGLCYSITYDFPTKNLHKSQLFGIIPDLKLLISEDNPKGVSFFLSTKNTRHNIIHQHWPYFKPKIISQRFENKSAMQVYFEEEEIHFYKGNPKCQVGCLPQQCLEFQEIKNFAILSFTLF